MKEFVSEKDRVRAWAAGAREASAYIAAETAERLREETPEESAKVCLALYAFYTQAGFSRGQPPWDDNLEAKVRFGEQMARLPRA